MNDIGVFTPEQARLLWQDYLSRKQLDPHVQHNYPQRRPIDEVSPHRVFVRNDSGEECPPYGCMQVTGTVTAGGRTVVTIEKPTTTDGEYLFCSQFAIADAAYGWAYRFDVVVMLGDGTAPTAANVEYSPVVGAWTITEGDGPFVVFGEHIDATDALIGRFIGGSGGGERIWFTIISVDCSATPWVLTVEPTYYSGGCTAAIPGEDEYGYVDVSDFCGIAEHFTAEWLIGKSGSASYAYPRTGYCVPLWLLDDICGEVQC